MTDLPSNSHEITIYKSTAPLHIKFALFCLNKPTIPKWFGYLCFILSHIQFLAVIIKCTYLALPDNTPSSSPTIHTFVKFFALGDWLSPEKTAALITGTLMIALYTISMLILMIYIHISLAFKKRIPDLIQSYWSVLHSLHPLLIFFWIHTFSMEVLKYSREDDFFREVEVFMTVMAYFNTVVNCVSAIFFSAISVTYKTKDIISTKTNFLETKSIIFKILIPALWASAQNNRSVQILLLTLALAHTTLHDWIFIKHLPYYKINILLLSSVLQAFQTSLALVSFIIRLVEAGGGNVGVFSVQLIWLVVLPISAKLYHLFTWKTLLHIYACEVKDETNLSYLVHKRFILLHFLKTRKVLNEGVGKLAFTDLMYQAKLSHVVADSHLPFAELDKNKKLLVRSLQYICLKILAMYPKSLLAQMNLAYFYSKFEDLYLVSNNLLEDAISKRPGYQAQISLTMIRFELQKKLNLQFSQKLSSETTEKAEGLNVYSYIISQELHEQVKNSIEKQVKLQSNFWKEFLSNKSTMFNLMSFAMKVYTQKNIVKKLWNNLLKNRPASFLSPLIVYGMYSSLINNDSFEGDKYITQSQEDAKKMKRYFKMDELNNHTIFSDRSVKITMSGLRSKLGIILDCSANICYSYGWRGNYMKNKPIASIMPPFYRYRHDRFLNNHFNTGKTKILNQTAIFPVKAANGYIRPTWIHAKVSPLMEDGILYVALLRPCRSTQRMILIRKDGKIDDMSLEFAQDMNLIGKEEKIEADIFTLCPEFRQINDAFNIIADNIIENNSIAASLEFKSKHDLSPNRRDQFSDIQTSSSVMIKLSSTQINKREFLLETDRNQETQENNMTMMDKSSMLHGGDTSSRALVTKRGNEKSLRFETHNHLKTSVVEDELIQFTSIEKFHSIEKFVPKEAQAMENSQAQSIYDTFTNGATVVFHPQSAYYTTGNKINLFSMMGREHLHNEAESITYNVKVTNNIHGKEVIKYVMLEKIAQGDPDNNQVQSTDEEDNTSPSLKFSEHGRRKETFFSPNFNPKPSPDTPLEPFFLNTPTPAKIKLDLSFTNNEASILDELQSSDTKARKAVFRNIVPMPDENYGQSSPRRKPKSNTIYTFHESMSFNQAADEALEISFHRNQTHRFHETFVLGEEKKSESPKNNKPTAEEENHMNTKLKKFKQRLEEAVMNVHRAESVTSTYFSKGKKVQQLVTQALKTEPRKRSALIYTYIFILFVVSMIILLLTQNENLHRGISAIQREVPVINRAFLRQNAMISSATGVRAWRGALQGDYTTGDWLTDNYQWQHYLAYYTDNMTTFNTEMYELLNQLPQDTQDRLYEKNVGIYEYTGNGNGDKTLVTKEATFGAFQMMIEKEIRCLNMEVPLSYTPDIDTSTFKFIVDNILNDLLVQSQSQINHLTEDLNDLTKSTKTKMALTLGGVVAICVIFAAVSIRYLYLLASEAKIFMITIFRIKSHESQAVQDILQRFRSALETDLKDFELPPEERIKEQINNNDTVKFRKASMSSLYKSQKIAFLKLSPNSTLFVCWSIVYFFLTSDFIGDIQDSEKQMETALQALNNQSLFVTEMIGLILTNITVNIKNQPALPDFIENLNNLQQTTLLIDNLRDKNGDLTALQEKVLFDFPCEDFLTFYNGDYAYAYKYCLSFGKGKTSIGLVSVDSELYSIGLKALQSYNSSYKTKPELAYIFLVGLSESTAPINCAEGFLNILYRSTLENFEHQVDSIEHRTMIFTILIFVFALIGTITTWHFVMKEIFKTQKLDWYILQIVPIKLILGNKHIQQYLLKHSDGMLDGVKSFL